MHKPSVPHQPRAVNTARSIVANLKIQPLGHFYPTFAQKTTILSANYQRVSANPTLENWTGETFIPDFTCTWFPKHGKGEARKLWQKKSQDEGYKFGEKRTGSSQ